MKFLKKQGKKQESYLIEVLEESFLLLASFDLN